MSQSSVMPSLPALAVRFVGFRGAGWGVSVAVEAGVLVAVEAAVLATVGLGVSTAIGYSYAPISQAVPTGLD